MEKEKDQMFPGRGAGSVWSYEKNGGEDGIRTHGTGFPVHQISNLALSTTQPPLRLKEKLSE
jgi:hypothetical protein